MRTPSTVVMLCTLGLTLAAAMPSAHADGAEIVLHGNTRGAPACIACHGTQGEGAAASGFPRLAGLDAGYVHAQLEAFAAEKRTNAIMTPIAQALSAAERKQLADYYSGLGRDPGTVKAARPQADKVDPISGSAGAQLALKGRWENALPACVQCHGSRGAGVGSAFPALAGQPALYIENQLRAWQQGTRAPGPLGLMKVIADKLSTDDIKQVAAYFAALSPDRTTRGDTP
ncbi:MAG: c-type cytochrome [Thiobacillus sp.]|nr:c-type cytochrome [Thiobacillus sp.]